MILSLKSTPVLLGWLAVWMFGVTMATVRTILMLWGAIDDSKVDEEFDWTMPVIGSVIYIVFGGTNAVQFYTGTATNYSGPSLKTQHNLDVTFRESYRKVWRYEGVHMFLGLTLVAIITAWSYYHEMKEQKMSETTSIRPIGLK